MKKNVKVIKGIYFDLYFEYKGVEYNILCVQCCCIFVGDKDFPRKKLEVKMEIQIRLLMVFFVSMEAFRNEQLFKLEYQF